MVLADTLESGAHSCVAGEGACDLDDGGVVALVGRNDDVSSRRGLGRGGGGGGGGGGRLGVPASGLLGGEDVRKLALDLLGKRLGLLLEVVEERVEDLRRGSSVHVLAVVNYKEQEG